ITVQADLLEEAAEPRISAQAVEGGVDPQCEHPPRAIRVGAIEFRERPLVGAQAGVADGECEVRHEPTLPRHNAEAIQLCQRLGPAPALRVRVAAEKWKYDRPAFERGYGLGAPAQPQVRSDKVPAPRAPLSNGVQLEDPTGLGQRFIVAPRKVQHRSQASVVDGREGIQVNGGLHFAYGVVKSVGCHEVPPVEQMRSWIAG